MDYDERVIGPLPGTLEMRCFRTVVQNFDRFMIAYNSGKSIPPHYFEFLQRRYSQAMFENFFSEPKTLVKYFDFLLNPYLKEINLHRTRCTASYLKSRLPWFLKDRPIYRFGNLINVRCIMERLRIMGDTITHLSLVAANNSTSVLIQLTSLLPNVKSLTLYCCPHVNNKVLQNIGQNCHLLEVLDLFYTEEITDDGLKAFYEGFESTASGKSIPLLCLDVMETSVTAAGLNFALKHFPNLKILRHQNLSEAIYSGHYKSYLNGSLSNVEYKLEELDLKSNKYFEYSVDVLTMFASICPHISRLYIPMEFNQEFVNTCASFSELKEIYFSYATLGIADDIDLTPLVKLRGKNLNILDINGGSVSTDAVLRCCPKLKCIRLRNTFLKPERHYQNGNSMHVLPNLKDFIIEDVDLGDRAMSNSVHCILASSPNLEKMHFVNNKHFSSDFVNAVIRHKCILSVCDLDITLSTVQFPVVQKLVLAAPNLEKFSMLNCGITETESEILRGMINNVTVDWVGPPWIHY